MNTKMIRNVCDAYDSVREAARTPDFEASRSLISIMHDLEEVILIDIGAVRDDGSSAAEPTEEF